MMPQINQELIEYSPEESTMHLTAVLETLPEQGTLSELWRFCRVCACTGEDMVPIYGDSGIELQLEEKINQYLPITVSLSDHLPLHICSGCVDKLNITHELIVSCLDSQARFTQFTLVEESDCEVGDKPTEQGEEVAEDELDGPGEDNAKVKKKVVVLKLVHTNNSHLSPSVRIAKALEFLKSKKKDTAEDSSASLEEDRIDDLTDKPTTKKNSIRSKSDMDKMEVASIAEFCVVTSKKDSSNDLTHETPKLQSKISKALGKVDNGTKQRIVEAVQNIVAERSDSPKKGVSCRLCNMTFRDLGDLSSHLCKRRVLGQRGFDFKCRVCDKKLKDRHQLTVHRLTHPQASAGAFSCDRCGETFVRLYSLHIHQLNYLKRKPFQCKCCGRRFLHNSSLHLHEVFDHSGVLTKSYKCPVCGKGFCHASSLCLHRQTHTDDGAGRLEPAAAARAGPAASAQLLGGLGGLGGPAKPAPTSAQLHVIVCGVCKSILPDQQAQNAHMKMHAQEQLVFKCSECPKAFPTLEKLRQHEPIHQGVRPYQCEICSIGFIRKGNLTKHYKTHSTEKLVTCRICKATFPSIAGLLNHRKTHTSSEWKSAKEPGVEEQQLLGATDNYQCPVCNKFLSSKLSLSLHMRVHTGEKPYECGVCTKRFTQKPALTYHMRLHTGERPHACQFCGKGFNSKVGKESHERIHTGERPYKCGQCGVGFRCSANLRQHTWIHTDNRPFTCEVCNKLFRRREALQVHMRIHTGERPYSCAICGRSFTQKGDMLKHTRSHSKKSTRVPGVTCVFCGVSFSRKTQYKAHVEKCSRGREQEVVCTQVEAAEAEEASIEEAVPTQPAEEEMEIKPVEAAEPQLVAVPEESAVLPDMATNVHSSPAELITFKEDIILKNGAKDLNTVTVAAGDMMNTFSEITIVTNDIQEYEVEYQS